VTRVAVANLDWTDSRHFRRDAPGDERYVLRVPRRRLPAFRGPGVENVPYTCGSSATAFGVGPP
jgi:hypothetical protein